MWVRVCTIFALFVTSVAWAANDESLETALTTFRITTAEVHVAITVVNERNQPVSLLTQTDFELLRDGHPVQEILSFQRQRQGPLSVLVLTDVSDSMTPGLPLERQATEWLRTNSDPVTDRFAFFDFGSEIRDPSDRKRHNDYLTSFYDSAFQIIPRLAFESSDVGRRALILLTDGIDNSSLHTLQEVIRLAQKYDVAVYAITAAPNRKQNVEEDVLTALTMQTGGRFYRVRKQREMLAAITAINDELRNGYELVVRADAEAGVHRIAIRPKGKSGLRFFYRAAYYQPPEGVQIAAK